MFGVILVLSGLLFSLSCSVRRKDMSDGLISHWSSSVRSLSLSSCSILLSSESSSSFKDSSSIVCNSSVISCMSAVLCFALSCNLLLRLAEGLAGSSHNSSCLNNVFLSFFRWFNTFPFSIDLFVLPHWDDFCSLKTLV